MEADNAAVEAGFVAVPVIAEPRSYELRCG
jgi:hypothetical protein